MYSYDRGLFPMSGPWRDTEHRKNGETACEGPNHEHDDGTFRTSCMLF